MEIDTTKLNETIYLLRKDVQGFCSASAVVIWQGKRVQIQLVVTGDVNDFIEHDGEFICLSEGVNEHEVN